LKFLYPDIFLYFVVEIQGDKMNFEKIVIQPFYPEDNVNKSFLKLRLEEIFHLPVKWNQTINMPIEAYDSVRGQFLGSYFLKYLANLKNFNDLMLGVVSEDLYEPGLNFVFGVASSYTKTGVISTYRLHNSFYGLNEDYNIFMDRVTKEAVHELGHTLGLGHCPDPECVMHFSNSIEDTDRKSYYSCPICYQKVKMAIGL
jgi:archaemetzincin